MKEELKKGKKKLRTDQCGRKEQQSKLYREQEQECHLNPGKTAAIMTMLEQMVENRSWKETRALIDDDRCRICNQHSETVEHLVAGCAKLANSEYLARHNRAMMIRALAWAKQEGLMDQEATSYQQKWDRGKVLESNKAKLVWGFEFHLRKTTTARRPYLILELKIDKKISICSMAWTQQTNIGAKRAEKTTKYRQITFETRERRPVYEVYVAPVVVGALGGGIKVLRFELKKTLKIMNCWTKLLL